ncbi:MAG: transcription antitermination factor NusB [Rikenellaceae bacterium]
MLTLPTEVARYNNNIIDSAKDKIRPSEQETNPNMRFAENPVIAQLSESKAINTFMNKRSLSWSNNQNLIKGLYQNMSTKEYFINYMSQPKCTYNDHKNLIIDFFKNEIEDYEYLYDEIEDMSIFWADDIEYAASHALQTITEMSADCVTGEKYKEIKLLPMYKDVEDQEFAKDLFLKAITHSEDNLKYIDSFTHNWDVERIAFMDRIIMLAAIVEIKDFHNIPINVTMNEYIEIAKYYSTTRSGNFVNGVLDKIISDMKEKKLLSSLK